MSISNSNFYRILAYLMMALKNKNAFREQGSIYILNLAEQSSKPHGFAIRFS